MKTLIFVLLSVVLLISCKKDSIPSVAEQLQKVWVANVVKEGATTVFTKGAATNTKPGYSQFRLDLSSATSVRLTEFDGNSFVGTWEVSADEKILTLKNLNPQPSDTGGTIAYSIGSVNHTDLVLIRTTASLKTGGTVNVYSLTK